MLSGAQRSAAALGHVADVSVPRFAWKTGTSSAYRDAWTVAWNPEWAIGVWCGHMSGGFGDKTVVGAKAAAPVAWSIARALYPQNDGPWYVEPEEAARLRGDGGRLVSKLDEVDSGLQISRPEEGAVFVLVPGMKQQKIVCQDLVSRCLPLFHCLHGNLQHITGRIEMGSIDLLAIQPYGQLLEIAQMLHIDQQRLNPFARLQLVVSRFHGTHERIGIKWFHQHPFRPFQPNLVESNPGALQNRQRDLVATRVERACLNGNLQQALISKLFLLTVLGLVKSIGIDEEWFVGDIGNLLTLVL
jgi:hypothetical protein